MSKTKFVREKKRNILLFSTSVENMFISELLPLAPGDYVKVYLFGLMYAQYEEGIDDAVASNVLNLPREVIEKAWAYWEDKGAIRRAYDAATGNEQIRFVSQLEEMYGNHSGSAGNSSRNSKRNAPDETIKEDRNDITGRTEQSNRPVQTGLPVQNESDFSGLSEEERKEKEAEENELRALYTEMEQASGRPISVKEMNEIKDAVQVYEVSPDVYAYAIQYCKERDKYNVSYISKVAVNWVEEGCKDVFQVKEMLAENSRRDAEYQSIIRRLGYRRPLNDSDRAMMSKWLDDMGFTVSQVLEVCEKAALKREPSLNYVDKVLENRMREAGGINTKKPSGTSSDSYRRNVSKRVLGEYYEFLRNRAEMEHQEHIEEVNRKVPALRDLLSEEKKLNQAILTFDFSSNSKEKRRRQIQQRKELDKRKRELLKSCGYPEDYLDKKFKCEICRDTGVTDDGRYCSCAKARVEEAYKWNLKRTQKQK